MAFDACFDVVIIWQVEEEIGIRLKLEDMVDLTGFLDPSTGCRVFPSPVSSFSLISMVQNLPVVSRLVFSSVTVKAYC